MPQTVTVKAKAGLKVPKEGAPRRYIDENTAVQVERTTYYERRIRDGELIVQEG